MDKDDEPCQELAGIKASKIGEGNVLVELTVIKKDIEFIKCKIEELEKKIDNQYVTRMEFEPIKKIVYGIVTLVLTAVVVALIGLVVMK